jgi:hypothetical protein
VFDIILNTDEGKAYKYGAGKVRSMPDYWKYASKFLPHICHARTSDPVLYVRAEADPKTLTVLSRPTFCKEHNVYSPPPPPPVTKPVTKAAVVTKAVTKAAVVTKAATKAAVVTKAAAESKAAIVTKAAAESTAAVVPKAAAESKAAVAAESKSAGVAVAGKDAKLRGVAAVQ